MDEARGHVVIAGADSTAYSSLRRRPQSRAQRYQLGHALRKRVSRSSLAVWRPPAVVAGPGGADHRVAPGQGGFADPGAGVPDGGVPVRIPARLGGGDGRGRGTPASTGITPVVCGDAHLGNFGFYASPERDLVIDLNDFDEAHPAAGSGTCAGWWPASGWPGGRTGRPNRTASGPSRRACRRTGRRSATWPTSRCCPGPTSGWTSTGSPPTPATRGCARRSSGPPGGLASAPVTARSPVHRADRAGLARIVEEPPLITRVPEQEAEQLAEGLDEYLSTLAPHWRRVLGGYTLVDIAHKVVGVGSVGLRAYVACWRAAAQRMWCSCSSSRPGGRCWPGSCTATRRGTPTRASGVEYQQALQTVSDPLLGWMTAAAGNTTCGSSAT